MGSWAVVTFVRAEAEAVAAALEELFARDGYRPTEPPADEPPRKWNYTNFTRFTDADVWIARLGPTAASGWTPLMCTPIYLLCGRAVGSDRPRLAELASGLSADAFGLQVYDGECATLVECAADGRYALSGSTYEHADEIFKEYGAAGPPGGWSAAQVRFYEERIPAGQEQFRLIPDLVRLNGLLEDLDGAAEAICRELYGTDDRETFDGPAVAKTCFRRPA